MYPKLALCALLCLASFAGADEAADCLVCHNNPHFVVKSADGKTRKLFVDPERWFGSIHAQQKFTCLTCHGNLGVGPHGDAFNKAKLPDGPFAKLVAAQPRVRQIALSACFGCHAKQTAEFAESIHGQQAAAGNTSVPLCTDCHGAHGIRPKTDIESAVNDAHVPATCAKCHADEQRMGKFGVSTEVVSTYKEHFHGRKRMIGNKEVAVCTSCHGVHNILGPQDPRSSVNPANAQATCGQVGCHPNDSAAFAASFKHRVPSPKVEPLVWVTHIFHIFMMYLVLGTMFIHILLDIARRKINKSRALRAAHGGAADSAGGPR